VPLKRLRMVPSMPATAREGRKSGASSGLEVDRPQQPSEISGRDPVLVREPGAVHQPEVLAIDAVLHEPVGDRAGTFLERPREPEDSPPSVL